MISIPSFSALAYVSGGSPWARISSFFVPLACPSRMSWLVPESPSSLQPPDLHFVMDHVAEAHQRLAGVGDLLLGHLHHAPHAAAKARARINQTFTSAPREVPCSYETGIAIRSFTPHLAEIRERPPKLRAAGLIHNRRLQRRAVHRQFAPRHAANHFRQLPFGQAAQLQQLLARAVLHELIGQRQRRKRVFQRPCSFMNSATREPSPPQAVPSSSVSTSSCECNSPSSSSWSMGLTKRQFTSVTFSSSCRIACRAASTIVPMASTRTRRPSRTTFQLPTGSACGSALPVDDVRRLVARVADGKRPLVIDQRRANQVPQFLARARRGDHHFRNRGQIRQIEAAVMRRPVFAHQSRAVEAEHHRQMPNRAVVQNVVVGALQKRRIDRAHRPHSRCGHARGKRHRVPLGDPHVKEMVGMRLRVLDEPRAFLHRRRNRDHAACRAPFPAPAPARKCPCRPCVGGSAAAGGCLRFDLHRHRRLAFTPWYFTGSASAHS